MNLKAWGLEFMIYLDNAATTPMDEDVVGRVHESMRDILLIVERGTE